MQVSLRSNHRILFESPTHLPVQIQVKLFFFLSFRFIAATEFILSYYLSRSSVLCSTTGSQLIVFLLNDFSCMIASFSLELSVCRKS